MTALIVVLAIVVFGLLLAGLGIGLSRRAQRRTREISEQLGIPVERPPRAEPEARGQGTVAPPARPAPPIRPRPGRPPAPPEGAPAPPVPEAPRGEPSVTFPEAPPAPPAAAPPAAAPPVKPRLRDRLGRTRAAFSGFLSDLTGRGHVDDEIWDE